MTIKYEEVLIKLVRSEDSFKSLSQIDFDSEIPKALGLYCFKVKKECLKILQKI